MSDRQRDTEHIKERLAAEGIMLRRDLYSLLQEPKVLSRAAPVLLELLDEVRSPITKQDLARVASSARIAPRPLVEKLRNLRPAIEAGDEQLTSLAWTISEALRKTADVSVFADLAEIVQDERFGRARQMLPYALARVKPRREDAIQVLLGVLDDKDLTLQVLDALGGMKAVEAASAIRGLLESPNRYARSGAKKALKKLEKAAGELAPERSDSPFSSTTPLPGLSEASTNFNLDQVPAFLAELATIVEEFGLSEVERVESKLLVMEPDEEECFDFQVRYGGEEIPLQIRIYMSDVNAPEVAFFTSSKLAKAIDKLLDDLE